MPDLHGIAKGARCSSTRRASALVEVFLVFIATHVVYRALQRYTVLGDWDQAAGTNFIPGAVFIVATIAQLVIGRRRLETYGLSLRCWKSDVSLGLSCCVPILIVAAIALAITGSDYDPSRPPDPHGPPQRFRLLGALALGLVGLLTLLGVNRRRGILTKVPPVVSVALLVMLLATPAFLGAYFRRSPVWPTALWLFFGAGVGEEMFFRGYVQSRVDEAFGLPYRLFGCDVGLGLLTSALLFGLIHALNTVDYFERAWNFGWWYGVQNFFVGLLYGCLRSRTGSVWAGAVTHGSLDVLGTVPKLLRGE
jgi:CAAX protease family protein